MQFKEKLTIPGEHVLILQGEQGQIEAVLTVPEQLVPGQYIAFLGHPHSLQGGTMSNKVVTTMARAFKDLGIPSLRFNFRGVGLSAGSYDAGIGESKDMMALMQQWQQECPAAQFILAGFSFGSYVVYRVAAQLKNRLLLTIAPAIHHYNYQEFTPSPRPWIVFQGDEDEVVPFSLVKSFASSAQPALPLIEFAKTSHFFHGQLIKLKERMIATVQEQVFSV